MRTDVQCWSCLQVHGIIDENTLVWGQGLADWLPIRNVRTLVAQIRTMEGRAQSDLRVCKAPCASAHRSFFRDAVRCCTHVH